MNCYNGSKYLNESIKSILNQTYKNWELVFWDNCSTDNSYEVFSKFKDCRLKYFKSPKHTGLGMARLNALNCSEGDFIAFLDCDDIWIKDKLKKQIPKFEEDSEVGIVISNTEFFTDSGTSKVLYKNKYPKNGWVFAELLKKYFISLETVILRKKAINSLNHSFDPTFNHISDLDLILRISEKYKLSIFNEVLAKWRVHSNSGTWTNPENFINEKKILANKLKKEIPSVKNKFLKEYNLFVKSIYIRESISLIISGDSQKARKLLSEKLFYDFLSTLLYFFSFIYYSKNLLLYIIKKRKLNPD